MKKTGTIALKDKFAPFGWVKYIFPYLFMLILIMSGTVMWHYISFPTPSQVVFKYLVLLLCCTGIVMFHRYTYHSLTVLFGMFLYMMLFLVVTPSNRMEYIRNFIVPFVLLLLFSLGMVRCRKTALFLKSYSNIICILAAFSLIFWIFGSLIKIAPGRHMIHYDWSKFNMVSYTYYYLYFENPVQADQVGSSAMLRNTGFCPEAPGYSSFLIYALLIEIFQDKKSKLKIGILVAALVSTLSTKSFLFLLELAFLLFYFSPNANQKWKKYLKYLFVIFLFLGVTGGIVYLYMTKSDTASFSVRADDVAATMKTWRNHPLFGAGFNNYEEIISNFTVHRNNTGLSMGLFVLLAQGGIYLTMLYLGSFIWVYTKFCKTQFRPVVLIVSGIALTDLIISNVGYTYRFLLIVALGYAFGIHYSFQNSFVKGVQEWRSLVSRKIISIIHYTKF